MEAYVHIGMNKVGSSTIQEWLIANQSKLQDEGILYNVFPYGTLKPRNQPHYALSILAKAGDTQTIQRVRQSYGLKTMRHLKAFAKNFTVEFDDFIEAHPSASKLVISSEYLAMPLKEPKKVGLLDAWLEQRFDNVHYIVYIRQQEDWLASQFSQRLRQKRYVSFDEFILEYADVPIFEMLKNWYENSGYNLIVRLLNKNTLKGGSLVQDFGALLGLDSNEFIEPVTQNEGFTNAQVLDLLRHNLDDTIQQWYAQEQANTKFAFGSEHKEQIRQANASDNARIREMFLGDQSDFFY